MATKEGKGKKGRDSDKKSAKKNDDTPTLEEKKDETPAMESVDIVLPDATPEITPEQSPQEPTPEPVYDEPTLSELIIESYEGDKVHGLFDGNGEASFTGSHEYKGQFSQGLMHGTGSYIWADGVRYEGEFCRNEVTGKGLYTWTDGSTYEGDLFKGKRHGVGNLKCKRSKLSYSGEWSMGKRHGKGRMDYDGEGRSFYDGDWVNNVRHGWGLRQYTSGNMYQGMWFNHVRHGEGTMKWLDQDQIYSGQWENGIQHGMGQHIWLLRRVPGTQYPLRNLFDGEFVNGLRHGDGTFYYANGAKYEGGWRNNMKHGRGKFTFKNGRTYEGMFEKDHIVEFPEFTMDGVSTPDISQIRTRTPVVMDNVSVHSNDSRNTFSPSFQLDIDHLVSEFTESDQEDEVNQVMYVVMRHISSLRKVYNYYCCLGYEESLDNTYIMNKVQFWRLMKDCQFHHCDTTLMDIDRVLGHNKAKHDLHNPYERILQRQFINDLISIAFHIYNEQHEGTGPVLSWCLSKLISDNILIHACNVKGHFYYETRRAVNALIHLDHAYDIYQSFCIPRKVKPYEPAMKMRQFLFMMQDLKLINDDLTPQAVIDILAQNDPVVSDGDGCYNLELEMTFLEFFEALIGCGEVYVTEAVIKDPNTPRPSTVFTHDHSMFSMPASPTRALSQLGGDDSLLESGVHGNSMHGRASEEATTPVRGAANESPGRQVEPQQSQGTTVTLSSTLEKGEQGDAHQKNTSFEVGEGDDSQPLIQSSVSLTGAHTDHGADEDDEEEEVELDEATRQFNFWTHQIHIFFVHKFFPAAKKMVTLKNMVARKKLEESMHKLYH